MQVAGGPAIAPDGRSIAFCVRQRGKTLLYVMQADGTGARVVIDSLNLEGAPSWEPDGRSLTAAVEDHGFPRLYRVPVDGRAPTRMVREYLLDPVWSPDGRFAVYSGPDVCTMFSSKAVTAGAALVP